MKRNGIVSVIGVTGVLLLAAPIVVAQSGIETDASMYAAIVGGTIFLVVAAVQANRLLIRYEKVAPNGKQLGEIDLLCDEAGEGKPSC